MTKEILYYTDTKIDKKLFKMVQKQIKKSGLPIICVSLNKPVDFGQNFIYFGERGYLSMFKQILLGLKMSKAKYVFMCEHDVLYHPSHFDFTPPRDDVYYYNSNAYKYKPKNGKIVKYDHRWLSQLCANRKLLIQHYEKKIKIVEEGKERKFYGYEPGTGHSRNVDNYGFDYFKSEYPNIDIRHGHNLSGTGRMKIEDFRDKRTCKNFKEHSLKEIPGWSYQFLSQLATKNS
jgi:hypothetical protein